MLDRFTAAGKSAWGLLGVAAVTAVVFWIAYRFRMIFPHLVFAGAIVFILNPIVDRLERRRIPRVGGTAIAYLIVVGIFALGGLLLAPLVQSQAEQLAEDWPEIRDDLIDRLDEWAERSEEDNWPIAIPTWDELQDQLGGTTPTEVRVFDETLERVDEALRANGDDHLANQLDSAAGNVRSSLSDQSALVEQLDTAREIGTRIVEVGLIFILGPIVAFYLLVDLPQITASARKLIPAAAEPQVMHVADRLAETIGGFFRGQLMVALIVGAMSSVALGILGLQFWIIVGMIAGFFNMIPLIGPWVGGVPGVAIALTTADFQTAVWVVVIMVVVQQIDNHFISPLVMQRTTQLHPAVVMMALLAGASLGGFFGLLLAVPITATLKVVGGHLWRVYVLDMPFEEAVKHDVPPMRPESPVFEYVTSKIDKLGDDPGDEDSDRPDTGDTSTGDDA